MISKSIYVFSLNDNDIVYSENDFFLLVEKFKCIKTAILAINMKNFSKTQISIKMKNNLFTSVPQVV